MRSIVTVVGDVRHSDGGGRYEGMETMVGDVGAW